MDKPLTINLPLAHKYGVQGLFQAVLRRWEKDGTYTDEVVAPWQENLITDFGMNGAATNMTYNYVSVGSGNTAPANTDTSLVSRVATQLIASSPVITSTTTSPYYNEYTHTYNFAVGAAAGNLNELGLHYTSTSYNQLCTRALFKDGSGNPVTIVVTASDQLILTYKIRIYLPEATTTNTFNIGGTDYTVTLRPAQLAAARNSNAVLTNGIGTTNAATGSLTVYYNNTGVLGAITGNPTGTNATETCTVTRAAYVSGNFYADYTHAFTISQANRANINCFSTNLPCPSYWQWSVSPAITKTSSQTLSFTHRVTWARYVP